MPDGVVLCSARLCLVLGVTAHVAVVVVAVSRELSLEALNGMPQRFWHDDQICTMRTRQQMLR